MKHIDVINQVQRRFFQVTVWLVLLSTATTCVEFVCGLDIFERPHTDYFIFISDYYPVLGADLCAFFLLRSRWSGAPFIMPLFMWVLFSRVSHPVPPSAYNILELLVYMIGVVADLAIWIMMFFLILVSFLKLRFLRRLHQYLQKNPDSIQALEEQAAVTNAAAIPLPKIGLHLHGHSSRWDASRQALLILIGMLLLLSPLFWVLQMIPTSVNHTLRDQSVSAVTYIYASFVFLPALYSVFAAVMIFKTWKSIPYLLPLLVMFLWGSAFFWNSSENSMPHELIANTVGKYTDRVLIGLILLNTLLLPIDWIKGFRAKKTAQAS